MQTNGFALALCQVFVGSVGNLSYFAVDLIDCGLRGILEVSVCQVYEGVGKLLALIDTVSEIQSGTDGFDTAFAKSQFLNAWS